MNGKLKNALLIAAAAVSVIATQAAAQITFYEREGFAGRTFTTENQIGNFERFGFNDRASSVIVSRDRWEVCEDAGFAGRCVVLRPGRYPSLAALNLNKRVSSVRTVSTTARRNELRYAPVPAVPQVIFYEREGFQGRSFTTENQIGNFERFGFNDRAASVVVVGDQWEVCEDAWFSGQCVVLRPGRYESLAAMGLNDSVSSVRVVSSAARLDDNRYTPAPAPVIAQINPEVIFYEREGFEGRSYTTREQIDNLERYGFNDRASSVVVVGEAREVCEDARFGGRCVLLRPGRYPSLAAMGLNDRVSSVRIVSASGREETRYLQTPTTVYDYRRRDDERLYEASVTSVRAVVATASQRCWVEREQIAADRSNANVPAAIAGAVIGGILGHQIGSGRGNDAATIGGAIAGAAVGANVGRDGGGQLAYTQDVQRCSNVSSQARPDYWDVTYVFRGMEHRVQMASPPGSTVTVNGQGEPRA